MLSLIKQMKTNVSSILTYFLRCHSFRQTVRYVAIDDIDFYRQLVDAPRFKPGYVHFRGTLGDRDCSGNSGTCFVAVTSSDDLVNYGHAEVKVVGLRAQKPRKTDVASG